MNIKNKGIEILMKIIIILSCPVLTLVLSNRYEFEHAKIGAILSLITIAVIMTKVKIKKIEKNKLLITFFLSCYAMKTFIELIMGKKLIITTSQVFNIDEDYLKYILGSLALPSLMFFIYKFIQIFVPKVKSFFENLSNVERKYLKVMLVVGIVLSIYLSHTGTAFSTPIKNNNYVYYDAIYTSDTGVLVMKNAFLNFGHEENDFRQCLFALCALPFALPAKMVSEVLFFVPRGVAYGTTLMIMQFVLISVSTILIARMMKLEEKDKKYLYLLFGISFPYMVFTLIVEQYVIALFYLILTIYNIKKCDGPNIAYVGAVGTLITSGVMVTCIAKFKNIKQYIKDAFQCFMTFVSAFIITGQVPRLWETQQRLEFYFRYTNYNMRYDNIIQFLNIVKAIFFSAPGYIFSEKYRMCVPTQRNPIGIIILCIMLISFILNRKERMAKVSFFWVVFSFFVLGIVGWGSGENGFMLYTLYFAWAYLVLYFLLIKKLFKNRKMFVFAILSSILIMAFFNIREFMNIITFAIKYY